MFNLFAIIEAFRVQDLFDILIISTLIYVVLIWFKDTASRFVFAGISLLGVVYIFARLFHLYLTSLVLQGFFAILLIALVVIFQEDIRRFFERLAVWGSLRKSKKDTSERKWPLDIEVLIESVSDLAARKIGAIIVIQGRDLLERHLKGGYELDGKLSQPLLASIFDPHSIGHDGAVIIEDSKVARFGCHLPLSLDTSKFGKFGLRHTAAIGLSERSDVLCIVVSEERGFISVVHDGRMIITKNPTELSAAVKDYFEHEEMAGSTRLGSGWLKKNTTEKGIALLLAFCLWFAFGLQKESVQRDYVVPIEFRNVSPDWEIEENRHREVTLTLTGPDQAFDLLDPSYLKVSVSLSNLVEGRQDVALSEDMVKIPSNLSLVRINPENIRVTANRYFPTSIPIQVRISGELPDGYALKGITAFPSSLQVMATRTFIRRKAMLGTETVDLSHINDNTTLETRILLPPDVHLKYGQSPWVRVVVRVSKNKS
jgi:diadenylate cyclase